MKTKHFKTLVFTTIILLASFNSIGALVTRHTPNNQTIQSNISVIEMANKLNEILKVNENLSDLSPNCHANFLSGIFQQHSIVERLIQNTNDNSELSKILTELQMLQNNQFIGLPIIIDELNAHLNR